MLALVGAALVLVLSTSAAAQSQHLAPGFDALPKGAKIVLMPTDIEMFLMSAGGVLEPKADWTAAASKHFAAAMDAKQAQLGANVVSLRDADGEDIAEINALHAAVARSIALHHFGMAEYKLPTKEGKLDWSLGDAVRVIKDKSGADYALFTWIRDSYASSERIATVVIMALLGVGVPGGAQVGYASLVELETGRIVWFNRLSRVTGDLREAGKARETVDTLLAGFPKSP